MLRLMAVRKKQTEAPFTFSPRPNRAAEIKWRPWGGAALRLSREQGKPVLLAISASWCHWCHVMDEICFSDAGVIRLINDKFIPVRVDSDRRPDINSRYNLGGWPTLAFLTRDGEMIANTTYIPTDQFSRLLGDIADLYISNWDKVEAAALAIRQQRQDLPRLQPAKPGRAVMSDVLKVISESYDQEFGGFGWEPKFPYAPALSFLQTTLADGDIETLDQMLRTTLDAMAAGGMYDRVEGGFFRYSTTRDWSIPHFEKLLEDNAALMAVYADAFLLTGDKGYESVASDVYRYLCTVLLDPQTGAFAGSQDSDERYYSLGAGDRAETEAPRLDRTVYASQNAATASALLRCFQAFGDPQFHGRAIAALEFIWRRLWGDDVGPSHYHDGKPHLSGLLADASRLFTACMDAYESGAGEAWLERAISVAKWLLANLEDKESGGFFDCLTPLGSGGLLAERDKPIMENSVAAASLIRLAQSTGQPHFGEAARRALTFFGDSYKQKGIMAAGYAAAVQRLFDPPVRVTIVGPAAADATGMMIGAAHRARIPFRSIEIVDPETHSEELEAAGYGFRGQPVAYVCIGTSRQEPVIDPSILSDRLEKRRRQFRV